MRNKQDVRGFTLMEMVVVLAVIAILAAILTPIINSYVDRARLNSARNDVKNIAASVVQFNTDLKFWPIYRNGGALPNPSAGAIYDWQATDGLDAGLDTSWTTGVTNTTASLGDTLNTNYYDAATSGPAGRPAYRGPYLELGPDPWGGRYYLTSKHLKPGNEMNAAYVVSAGPNQTIETVFDQDRTGTTPFVVGGDDVVARIR
jgi:prepilin-type N-terminal cleavage/methylation domain-containing protein